eukprot:9479279-Pyramimonas_sp.AAC.1
MSEAEKQAVAQRIGHGKSTIVEDAQMLAQHVEANEAGVTDEATRRLAQEEIETMGIQRSRRRESCLQRDG